MNYQILKPVFKENEFTGTIYQNYTVIIEDELGSVNVLMQLLADNISSSIQVIGVADTIQVGLELI